MSRLIGVVVLLCLTEVAWAENLGCFVPGDTISLPATYLNGAGVSTAATSKEGKLYRGTTTVTTVANGSFTQRDATNRPGEYYYDWDSTGATTGRHAWTIRGTVTGGCTGCDSPPDTFELAATCPLRPTTAGRTLDVNAGGEAGIDLDNTSGTLAKTTDITGFNDLSSAQVNAEADTALADYDPPTRTEATADKDAILADTAAILDDTGTSGVVLPAATLTKLGYEGACVIASVNNLNGSGFGNKVTLNTTGFLDVDNKFAGRTLWINGIGYPIIETDNAVDADVLWADVSSLVPSGTTGACEVKQ